MRLFTLVLLLCLLPFGVRADNEVPVEIDFLLKSIGSSDCTFIRNGERHNSRGSGKTPADEIPEGQTLRTKQRKVRRTFGQQELS